MDRSLFWRCQSVVFAPSLGSSAGSEWAGLCQLLHNGPIFAEGGTKPPRCCTSISPSSTGMARKHPQPLAKVEDLSSLARSQSFMHIMSCFMLFFVCFFKVSKVTSILWGFLADLSTMDIYKWNQKIQRRIFTEANITILTPTWKSVFHMVQIYSSVSVRWMERFDPGPGPA